MAALRIKGKAKAAARRVLLSLIRRLPPGGREAVFYELCERMPPGQVLGVIAQNFHIEELSVRGNYGTITQSADDIGVLPHYAKWGTWAERTNKQLSEFFASIGNKGAYVDVGANVGLTTIPLAQHPGIQCVAVEPDPTNFHYLSRNVSANCHHGNVTLHNVAIFSEYQRICFELDPHNLGDHRVRVAGGHGILNEQERKVIEVEGVPLDDILIPDDVPLVVKIDVQGGESLVTLGGPKTLGRADLLIMEVWPYGISRMNADLVPVLQLLREQFDSVQCCAGENGTPSSLQSPKQVEDELTAFLARNRTNPSIYMDIVARKSYSSRHARRPLEYILPPQAEAP